MSAEIVRRINPDGVAARLFPQCDPVDRECRKAIAEVTSARRWFEFGSFELANLEEMVWRDLLEIRNPDEDFDEFSARAAEFSAENSRRFVTRASKHLAAALECIQTVHRERELSLLAELAIHRRGK
jgi:hypothetical protein